MIDWIQTHLPNVYQMGWSGTYGWQVAITQTLYMTFWSFVVGGLLGLLGGLFLHRGLGGDRVLRGCLTIRHYNGYNGGCQTASRRYTFPPAGRTAGQAPENHTSTRLTCAASTYNPSPFRYWRAFLGAMPLLLAVRLGGIAFPFLSLLYAISPSFASCILYKLTKVICIF